MSKIKIKNFGPIKDGFLENDGWIDVKKITIFIGNQGSGKSTVAKLISTFMWVEKALNRGDLVAPISNQDFLKLIAFHRIQNYLEAKTEIEFEGESYHIKLTGNSLKKTLEAERLNNKLVKLPKIMYVPAERNFLSSIENINKVSNLIAGSLQNYSVEFRNAQLSNKGKIIDLPVTGTKVIYDSRDDQNYLLFGEKKLKLSEGSSGFHSLVPLYWVSKYLSNFVKQEEKKLIELLSTDQTVRRNNELNELNKLGLDEKTLKSKEKKINAKYVCKYLVNIVEEPEQNLFPTSQRLLLNSLIAFNNGSNMLLITTHSPYLINFISIAVKAYELKDKVKTKQQENRLFEIVPKVSTINPTELIIYQLDELEGTIKKLENFEGIPSDNNYLNQSIMIGNLEFDKLLDLEEEL
jgi:predicted ATPase